MRIPLPYSSIQAKHLSIVAVALLSLLLSSCTTNKEPKEISFTVVVADKIGSNKSDKLPDTILKLCQILEDCGKSNFVPAPTLKRIGVDGAELSLKTKLTGGVGGNKNNPNLIRRQIDAHLRAIEITNNFAIPNGSGIDLEAALGSYIGTVGNSTKIYYFSDNQSGDSYKGNKIFNDLDSLRSTITKQLCEEPPAPILIVINPLTTTITAGATPSETPNPGDTSKNAGVIEALHTMNVNAGHDPVKLRDADREIMKSMDASNYRFTYERVKNRIYGQQHHEAFDLLKEAAKIAIKNNEAREMLHEIERDEDGDLWKLSHGHRSQWNMIIDALNDNNEEALHKPHHSH